MEARARQLQQDHGFRYSLVELLASRRVVVPSADARVLTDDFAPVDTESAVQQENRPRW